MTLLFLHYNYIHIHSFILHIYIILYICYSAKSQQLGVVQLVLPVLGLSVIQGLLLLRLLLQQLHLM